MMRLMGLFKKEDGIATVLWVLGLPVVVFILVGTMLFMQLDYTKIVAQSGLNNGLLTAVTYAMAAGNANNTAIITSNLQNNLNANNLGNATITSLSISSTSSPTSWTADITVPVPNWGLNFNFIPPTVKISTTVVLASVANAGGNTTNTEVVFTVNASASMCLNISGSTNANGIYQINYAPFADLQCDKFSAMKQALIAAITNGIQPNEGFKVGFVPFNHKVHLPVLSNIPGPLAASELKYAEGWSKNEGSAATKAPNPATSYYTDFSDAGELPLVQALTPVNTAADVTNLTNYINGFALQTSDPGWVRSNIAVLTAALMLDPTYYSSFNGAQPASNTSAAMPDTFNSSSTQKIVVMMTDGASIGCCFSAWPDTAAEATTMGSQANVPNWAVQYLYLNEADNAHLAGGKSDTNLSNYLSDDFASSIPSEGICDQLKAQGVTIYSVFFDVQGSGVTNAMDPASAALKAIYQSCAGNKTAGSNTAYFFDVQNSADLIVAYTTMSHAFISTSNTLRILK